MATCGVTRTDLIVLSALTGVLLVILAAQQVGWIA